MIICLLLLVPSVPLFTEETPYEETKLRTGALIGGGVLGLGVIGVYASGPYTGFSIEDSPGATYAAVGTSSAIMISSSMIYSSLLTRSIYEKKNTPLQAGLKGAWTGALAGGLANGLSFSTMLGIGVSSGMITFNDSDINTWYEAAGVGFLGGFAYGAIFGALIGAMGGSILGAGISY